MRAFLVISIYCLIENSKWTNYIEAAKPFFQNDFIRDTTQFHSTYDFIIIGSGSAGSVVANRLSENPDWTILLLEAGSDEHFFTKIPFLAGGLSLTNYNWGYKSERSKYSCLGFIEGKCLLPRGKVLGGTSVINFMLYTRGAKEDFDSWQSLGNEGWAYDDVLPYFIKSENCTACKNINRNFHGFNGYLHVENAQYETPLVEMFLKSSVDLNYSIRDINEPHITGFSKTLATTYSGMRHSASTAFLKSVYMKRPNLHISLRSHVIKILIDKYNKGAYGVLFLKNQELHKILVRKEVILSAGSFNSPQLLMLSGIGPKEDLKNHNISGIMNLKVGYNLQDHISLLLNTFLVNQSVTLSHVSLLRNLYNIQSYLLFNKGFYTIPSGAEALGFIETTPKKRIGYPDIELILGAAGFNADLINILAQALGIPQKTYDEVYATDIGKPSFSITAVLLRPTSKGRVSLKTSNPLDLPKIEMNFLESSEDVANMIKGIKLGISIGESKHFKRYGSTLNRRPFPACKTLPFHSDAYWECVLRQFASTLGHQVGTCKMGPVSDFDAVVDPQLRVHGIRGLRVVDGSIMPHIIAGHPNSVIIMIGEKASDLIKSTWKDTYYSYENSNI